MCNILHPNSQPIPEEGFGWKLFVVKEVNSRKRYTPPYRRDIYNYGEYTTSYKKTSKGWVHWLSDLYKRSSAKSAGFGFFLDKKMAEKCLGNWMSRYLHRQGGSSIMDPTSVQVVMIKYKKGLGKHIEDKIGGNSKYMIGLCQSFKILAE